MTKFNSKEEIQESLDLIQDSLLKSCPGYSKEKRQCECEGAHFTCMYANTYRLIKECITERKFSKPQEHVEVAASVAVSSLLMPCDDYIVLEHRCTCPESKRQECKFHKAADLINETIKEIIGV